MALTIAGSDSGGGAGIQADLACFAAFGLHGTSAVTAVTAQSPKGISGTHEVPPEFIAEQIRRVYADLPPAAAKTGMLASAASVRATAEALRSCGVANLVVDPVVCATSGNQLLNDEGVAAVVAELFPMALVVTPNLAEAERILGEPVLELSQMRAAARRLHDLGPHWVLVKGGHLPGRAVDVLFGGGDLIELEEDRIDVVSSHGTGCVLSAAIAANLALGFEVPEAAASAKHHVTGAILHARSLASGGCVDPAWNLRDCLPRLSARRGVPF